MKKAKDLKDLTLLDRFLFAEAADDTVFMETVLEIILDEKITLRESPQTEKEVRNAAIQRQVRLDVLAIDENDTFYNTEAQKTDTHNLPKRSRYYQALIDSDLMDIGELDYEKLNELYLIMIMPFDLFGKGLYKYTFRNVCEEAPEIKLNDGVTRIFLNTHGSNEEGVSGELVNMLRYFEHTTAEVARSSGSERIERIEERIARIKDSEKIGVRYMQAWEEKILERREAREEGLKEGRRKGRKEGLAEGLKKGRDEGLKKGRRNEKLRVVEIAKGFKESNIPIDIIAKNTGLSKEEIEAL